MADVPGSPDSVVVEGHSVDIVADSVDIIEYIVVAVANTVVDILEVLNIPLAVGMAFVEEEDFHF